MERGPESSSTAGMFSRGHECSLAALVLQTMTAAHESVQPTLMKQHDSNVAGIAWSNIDGGCALNYQVKRGGYSFSTCFNRLKNRHSLSLHFAVFIPERLTTLLTVLKKK